MGEGVQGGGSQTFRILCYRKGPDKHGDVLLGRGALEVRTVTWGAKREGWVG